MKSEYRRRPDIKPPASSTRPSVTFRVSRALFSVTGFLTALCCLAGCGGGERDSTAATESKPAAPGKAVARIRVTPVEVAVNANYTVTYEFENATNVRYQVLRIETDPEVIVRTNPGWRQSMVQPGQTARIAEIVSPAKKPGPVTLKAAFVTDRGTIDAPAVTFNVTGPTVNVNPARIRGSVAVQPNPARPGEEVTVTYSLTDSSGEDCDVTGIVIDSLLPIRADNPAWLGGHVYSNSSKVIAQRRLMKSVPGSYEISAKFQMRQGIFPAPSVTLVVVEPVTTDTGHVTGRIDISPNPCPSGSNYRIEYQVVNTTRKDVTVSRIATDVGALVPGSAEWLTGNAPAGRTTTIARVAGTGEVTSSRTKTASFATSAGLLAPPPVVFIVQ